MAIRHINRNEQGNRKTIIWNEKSNAVNISVFFIKRIKNESMALYSEPETIKAK